MHFLLFLLLLMVLLPLLVHLLLFPDTFNLFRQLLMQLSKHAILIHLLLLVLLDLLAEVLLGEVRVVGVLPCLHVPVMLRAMGILMLSFSLLGLRQSGPLSCLLALIVTLLQAVIIVRQPVIRGIQLHHK